VQFKWLVAFYTAWDEGREDLHGHVNDWPWLQLTALAEVLRFYAALDFLDSAPAERVVRLALVARLINRNEPLPVARLIEIRDVPAWAAPEKRARVDYVLAALPYARRYREILSYLRAVAPVPPSLLQALPEPTLEPVVCGGGYTLVVTPTGLFACGDNTTGQLGMGADADRRVTWFQAVKHSGDVICLAAGQMHTMVLTTRGVFSCGRGISGQLGQGLSYQTDSQELRAVAPTFEGYPLSVACGGGYSMLITTEGLFACGSNSDGRLGLGDTTSRGSFTRVPGITGAPLSVFCGRFDGRGRTFLVTTAGLFYCDAVLRAFVAVMNIGSVQSIAFTQAGAFVVADSLLWTASFAQQIPTFERLIIGSAPCAVACGNGSCVVTTTARTLVVHGTNSSGQLGLGDTQPRAGFAPLKTDGTLVSVACGSQFTMVLTERALMACGENDAGQLGYSTTHDEYFNRRPGATGYSTVLGRAPVKGLPVVRPPPPVVSDEALYDDMRILLSLWQPSAALYARALALIKWNAELQAQIVAALRQEGDDVGETSTRPELAVRMRAFLGRVADLERLIAAYEAGGNRLALRERVEAKRLLAPEGGDSLKFGCRVCDSVAPVMHRELARPERLFCGRQCRAKFHHFDTLLQKSRQ
jgi:hypothetical protein